MTLKPTVRSKWTTTYLTSTYIAAYALSVQAANPSVNTGVTPAVFDTHGAPFQLRIAC